MAPKPGNVVVDGVGRDTVQNSEPTQAKNHAPLVNHTGASVGGWSAGVPPNRNRSISINTVVANRALP